MKYLLIYIVFLYSNIILCQQEYAWVYFKDKKNVEYFINNPELILTELSISKKQSKGKSVVQISNIRDEYLVELQKLRKKYEKRLR